MARRVRPFGFGIVDRAPDDPLAAALLKARQPRRGRRVAAWKRLFLVPIMQVMARHPGASSAEIARSVRRIMNKPRETHAVGKAMAGRGGNPDIRTIENWVNGVRSEAKMPHDK